MVEIHYSEIATYLKCKKQHELYYVKRIEPRRHAVQIDFGSFGHKCLETLVMTNGDTLAAVASVQQLCREIAAKLPSGETLAELQLVSEEAIKVGIRAYDWLNGRLVTVTHPEQGPLVEVHQRFVAQGVDFIGTPDWIVEDKVDGGYWVIDHKFRKMFREPWAEDLNLQMIFYQGLLHRSIGLETVGTKQFQIKPIAPKNPSLTSTGKISKADIMSTWEVYSKFVESMGEDPADFVEMKPKLAKHVWFDLDSTRTYRNISEVTQVWDEVIIPTAVDIAERKQKTTRCYDYFSCSGCSVRDYCVAEAKGGDTHFLMQTKFKSKDEEIQEFEVEFSDDQTL